MAKKKKMLFSTPDETLIMMTRLCFLSGQMSPAILYKATGVDTDACIDFLSRAFAEMLLNKPPECR